jgi:hypothetical protein
VEEKFGTPPHNLASLLLSVTGVVAVSSRCVSWMFVHILYEVLSYLAVMMFSNFGSTMLVLAMDVEEALVSLWEVRKGDIFVQTSLIDGEHEICKTFGCPVLDHSRPFLVQCHTPGHYFNGCLTQQRSCHSLCIYRRDHGNGKRVVFGELGKHLIHGLVLEKRDLVSIAQYPHVRKKMEVADNIEGSLKVPRVQPNLELIEEGGFHIGELNLAFGSLSERTIEGGAEIIRVEAEDVFVHTVSLLLFSDYKSHETLEMFAMFRISLSIILLEATYAEGFLSGVETAPIDGVAISVDLRERAAR